MSCSMPLKNSKEVKQRIVVQLDQDYWLASVGRMLKEHFPDVEFDFVISRGGAQYLNDAAGVEGILANTELFDEYGIQLPYNYDTFVEACNKFGEYGIRGFATDYKYDYTDSYMLQAWSIPLLQSSKGRIWRNDASEGNVDYLPDELGTQLFSRLEQVFKDTGVQVEDVSRGYSVTFEDFVSGRVAMIRQSTNIAEYQAEGMTSLMLLPYFGETENDDWYFSTPGYSVAMNGKLKGAGKREELALDIVRYFFSSEVMNAMADRIQSFVVYNKNVNVDVQDIFSNIVPYIESNRMYTYIRNDSVSKASYSAVQKMLVGEADARQAVKIFNDNYNYVKEKGNTVTTFDREYTWKSTDTGSESFSVRVNILREICGADMLIAPAAMNAGDIYKGDYTAAQLQALIMGGGVKFYTKDATGAEIKMLCVALWKAAGVMMTRYHGTRSLHRADLQ